MYKFEISGCLTLLITFLVVFFLVRELWWLIVGVAIIAIVLYYCKLIYQMHKDRQLQKEQNYNPEMGEVFKVCPYCNAKVKVTAISCPCCNRALN